MSYATLGAIFAIGLFLLMLIALEAGKRLGEWRLRRDGEIPHSSASVAEGAVLGLMGLLIAFTFSGANERFDVRRDKIVAEASAIETAYMRVDLVSPNLQPPLREAFRQYLDSRLLTYKKLPDNEAAFAEWETSKKLQEVIWTKAVSATNNIANQTPAQLLLPAINNMIDIAKERVASTKMHPPVIIFILLFALAILSAFLSGYSMAGSKVRSSMHIIGYAAITAVTIYIIINMEFPLLGTIHFNNFDQFLVNVRDNMGKGS